MKSSDFDLLMAKRKGQDCVLRHMADRLLRQASQRVPRSTDLLSRDTKRLPICPKPLHQRPNCAPRVPGIPSPFAAGAPRASPRVCQRQEVGDPREPNGLPQELLVGGVAAQQVAQELQGVLHTGSKERGGSKQRRG